MLIPRFSAVLNRDRLELRGWRLTPTGARRLADEPALATVRELDLTGNEIGDDGLAALLASPHLGRVTELRLAENKLTSAGLRALAEAPALAELGELDLAGNTLGPDAIAVLAPLLPRLQILDLGDNRIGDAGARALADAGFRGEELGLAFTDIGPAGLAALVDGGALARTSGPSLIGDPLGDEGAAIFARLAGQTDGFSSVDLGWTGLTAHGLERLLASGVFSRGISHLGLRGNPLGEAGLRVLATHPGLPKATLHLDDVPPALLAEIRARTRAIVAPPVADGRVLACPYCYEALDLATAKCPHCRLDATRDAPTDENADRLRDAPRRPCPHCGGAMHARYASRCPHCARWAVSADKIARDGAASARSSPPTS
ncbi:hypothetical protein KEG38_34230 [Polyangium jinanense]|uniref:hypothetical protein n=1 Tax=Polyangium jinanense TaxID=2829994 RepID=UPI002341E3CB|nr:hypothetical protein [Polyangium jinanense]MDC3958963.1 hypothetical protein [Polyangium jinanense]